MSYRTIDDIRRANNRAGHHWFEPDAMRFFRTVIESGVLRGRYFVTSEQPDDESPRRYSARRADDAGIIDTVGEFYSFDSLADAKAAIKADSIHRTGESA